ncbi:MAG: YfhO family protein, partial [Candidatus Hydrogenedentes bacterium]|nr:YfhO family protein [Candidatus Hydrogenedentota bacterium]
ESIDVPPGSPEFRYEPDFHPVYSVNGPLIKGYSTPQGIVSIEPARHLDYYLNRTALRLAGTKWIRTREGATPELADAAREGIEWVQIEQPMPRARFVTDAVVSTDFAQDLERIDMARTALVAQPLELESATPGTAEIQRDRPGSITVLTQTETRQLLILTEAYDDDWVLTIDDQPGAAIPVYGDFLGAVVPAGQHKVELRFDPRSFRLGKTITLFALFLSILFHLTLPRLLPVQSKPVDPNAV